MNVDKLRAIVESETDDLRTLAKLAGGHPSSFYRGVNFDGVDLREENLSGFDLTGSSFSRTVYDNTTIVDEKFKTILIQNGTQFINIEGGDVEDSADNLSISHDRTGDVLLVQGDFAGALAAYQDDLAIAERLAAQDPGNAQWQGDLSISYERIGDVLLAQGDGDGALRAYRADLAIAERLAEQDPGNAEWQRDLVVSHYKLGVTLLAAGDPVAREHAVRAQAQARLWAERFPQAGDHESLLRAVEDLVRRTEGTGQQSAESPTHPAAAPVSSKPPPL